MSELDVYIYEADVSPADESDSTRSLTYDIWLIHGDPEAADVMATRTALETFLEDRDCEGVVTDLRYVGGIHPIDRPTVISIQTQP